jgi:hypothetical protein
VINFLFSLEKLFKSDGKDERASVLGAPDRCYRLNSCLLLAVFNGCGSAIVHG